MIKNLKNKKKKGFTLVELVVVIAIIAILAAVLIPQITGYINDAKRTAVVAECKEVVTAVEAVNAQGTVVASGITMGQLNAGASTTYKDVAAKMGGNFDSINKIGTGMTYAQMKQAVETDRYEVVMDANGDIGTSVKVK